MTTAQLRLPAKVVANFNQPARHRVFKGGRGSGKTRSLATMSGVYGYKLAEGGAEGLILASREHLNSLEESSLEEIKAAIRAEPFLNDYYEIGEKYVRTKNRKITYAFAGLRHNLDSIKSKARILLNWTDEAESVSDVAWRKLIPTIREEGSENWISYNPESPESATHRRFIDETPSNCIITDINWSDNKWFPDVLNQERLDDQRLRPETYDHVWGGAFLTLTEAQIFAHKFDVDEFEPTHSWDGPYYGMDFGFAADPTAAVECYVRDKVLYIRRSAGKPKLELDDTGTFISDRMPGIAAHTIRADSARPESISYLKRHGLPRITGCTKWPGSVMDGIAHLKSYERIVIHPDCPEVAREFRLYSYKVDRQTGDIQPIILDANNHYIDAIRYALGPMITQKGAPSIRSL
jgi:phage terminase large subunit